MDTNQATFATVPTELLVRIKKFFEHDRSDNPRFDGLTPEQIADIMTAECEQATIKGDQIYHDICAALEAQGSLLKPVSKVSALPTDPSERARVTRENADYYRDTLKPFA